MAPFMTISKNIRLVRLPGYVDYLMAWRYQKALQEHVNSLRKLQRNSDGESSSNLSGYLLMLQHQNIYTLGKGGDISNIKKDGVDGTLPRAYRVERGGDVTWHGPGQLTMYPILDLSLFKRDLHWYLRELEEVVITTLANISPPGDLPGGSLGGLRGERSPVNTGVWIGDNKISAIGITASRWVTMHGCSINVDCDLVHFQRIVPCGIADSKYGVTSVLNEFGKQRTQRTHTNQVESISNQILEPGHQKSNLINLVSNQYLRSFANRFDVSIDESDTSELDAILNLYPDIKTADLSPLTL